MECFVPQVCKSQKMGVKQNFSRANRGVSAFATHITAPSRTAYRTNLVCTERSDNSIASKSLRLLPIKGKDQFTEQTNVYLSFNSIKYTLKNQPNRTLINPKSDAWTLYRFIKGERKSVHFWVTCLSNRRPYCLLFSSSIGCYLLRTLERLIVSDLLKFFKIGLFAVFSRTIPSFYLTPRDTV